MSSPPPRSGDALASLAAGARRDRLVHVHETPARGPVVDDWPGWVAPTVRGALTAAGIDRPWRHQVAAADAAYGGESVVLSTGTASGKSLGFLVPILTEVSAGTRSLSGRGATALYLSPTKALAADQLTRVAALAIPGVRAATCDGDTPPEERRWIRAHANYVLTNPDLLHHSLLPRHEEWAPFLRALRYVVVDESHAYRGVFGAHVAAVLRRLRRVCAHLRAEPTFVLASATMARPADHAQALTALPCRVVADDGSPRSALTCALWEPPTVVGEDGRPVRRSSLAEASELLADLVVRGVQTVVFARSRAGVEAVATGARRRLESLGAGALASRVAAYRGGYLPEERRALEAALRCGEVLGLAATNALELGVDVSGLDAVLVAGWPGTRASFWQQIGRAGRAGREALAIFVADDDPLDTYLIRHPEAIFGVPVEAAALDPENPYVLAPHVAAAAAEVPVTRADEAFFGPGLVPIVDALARRGLLRARPTGWYWTHPERPSAQFSLRSVGETVRVVERDSGRVVGTVESARADSAVHTGAVHVHQGSTYLVTALDLDEGAAVVVRGDPGWITQARSVSSFEIARTLTSRTVGPVTASYGEVVVRRRVTSFLRRLPGGPVLGEHRLDLPERVLTTKGVWWAVAPEALSAAGVDEAAVPGAAHAAEHAAIGMLPLLSTADRWDLGGVSTARHPDTGVPTIMVYDGHPGGAGFAERGFRDAQAWLRATREAVASCGCEDGCPACIQSPKCGNGNHPLDKSGAVSVLDLLLGVGASEVPA